MTEEELIKNLTFEYYAILAANPGWDMELDDFLRSRGIEVDENYDDDF